MKNLVIIPARSGSKRIANKNIKNFLGKPIIFYSIDIAKGLSNSKIHVSTESEEIAKIVGSAGLTIDFNRPKNLADDRTPILDVLKFVVGTYKKNHEDFESVVLLSACAPLLSAADVKKMVKIFNNNDKRNPVLAVYKARSPIDKRAIIENNILNFNKEKINLRSQDMQEYFFDAGVACIYSSDQILSNNLESFDFIPYILDEKKAIDIDEELDWLFAEFLYKKIKN